MQNCPAERPSSVALVRRHLTRTKMDFEPLARELPHFLVAGMPRGGTTSLYHHLSQHPNVFLPYRKEVNYFSVHYDRGLGWYASLYDERQPEQISGDISPPCFFDPTSIAKIRAHGGDTKVILVIRNPVEWAVSLFHQFESFKSDLTSLRSFLEHGYRHEIGGKVLEIDFETPWIAQRIRDYQRAFGENLLIYRFSYFEEDPLRALQVIERFLQLPQYFSATNVTRRRINASDRRNVRLISWILSRERLIDVIGSAVPRRLTMALRAALDRHSAPPPDATSRRHGHDAEELELARRYLADDQREVDEIFNGRSVLIHGGADPKVDVAEWSRAEEASDSRRSRVRATS